MAPTTRKGTALVCVSGSGRKTEIIYTMKGRKKVTKKKVVDHDDLNTTTTKNRATAKEKEITAGRTNSRTMRENK